MQVILVFSLFFSSPPPPRPLAFLYVFFFYFIFMQGTRELVFLSLTMPGLWPPVWPVFLNQFSNFSCPNVSIRQNLIAPLHMHLPTNTFSQSFLCGEVIPAFTLVFNSSFYVRTIHTTSFSHLSSGDSKSNHISPPPLLPLTLSHGILITSQVVFLFSLVPYSQYFHPKSTVFFCTFI